MIIHNLGTGGAERVFSFLANALDNREFEVHLYTYMGSDTSYTISDNVKRAATDFSQRNRLYRFISPLLPVRKKIREVQPDLVISFLTNPNLYSVIGTLFTKIPVIISERGDPFTADNLMNRIKKFFYGFADGIVFQTDAAKNYYSKKIKAKSAVIPNPVQFVECQTIDYSLRKNEIAFVARFEIAQKRQDVMINAFKLIADEDPNVKLVFYGDGDDKHTIESMVLKEHLSDRVVFLGNVEDVADRLRYSKVGVLTSDYEGIPNSVIEALSVGVPVVSTDCSPGGARVLIRDGVDGFVVPKGDSKLVAERVLFLLNNPEKAKEFSESAMEISARFSPDFIVSEWMVLIDKVILQ